MGKLHTLRFLNGKYFLIGLVVFALCSFLQTARAEYTGLQDFQGNPQVLKNYVGKGKWLVVMIWASDCRICNREAHQYVDFHLVHSADDATVLGISIDGESKKKEAEKFIKKHMIDFPNLIAEQGHVAEMYKELTGANFLGTPTILIYSPQGELKAADAGAVPTSLIEKFIAQNSVKKEG